MIGLRDGSAGFYLNGTVGLRQNKVSGFGVQIMPFYSHMISLRAPATQSSLCTLH